MKRSFLLVVVLLLTQLALAQTSIPLDSHFVLSVWDNPTNIVTYMGPKGITNSVLATSEGKFGFSGSPCIAFANDTFGFSNIIKYSTELDETLKNEIMELAGDDGIKLKPMANIGTAWQFGPVGLSARVLGDGEGYLSRDLLDLALFGNELNRTYNLNPNLRLALFVDTKAQIAVKIPFLANLSGVENLTLGAAYHYIPAGVYLVGDTPISYTAVYTETEAENEIKVTGDLYLSKKASGSSLDLGVLIKPTEKLYLALSVEGINGKVNWSEFYQIRGEDLLEAEIKTVKDLAALGSPVQGEITQKLPFVSKLGLRYDWKKWLTFFAEAKHTKLEDKSSFINATAGTDMVVLWVLPFKASVTYDSRFTHLGYNLGTGLKIFFFETTVEGYTRPTVYGDEVGINVALRTSF